MPTRNRPHNWRLGSSEKADALRAALPPGSISPRRGFLLPGAAAVGLALAGAGCMAPERLPPRPAPHYEVVDLEHGSTARLLARELGLQVREDSALHTFNLEGEAGRIVLLEGGRTAVVGGSRLECAGTFDIAGGDVLLRTEDAARIRATWRDLLDEARSHAAPAAAAPPPSGAGGGAPREAADVPSDPAWRVPLRRTWKGILIHHSATPSGNMAEFDKHHREVNGWLMVGYDFIICNGEGGADGLVETTGRWKQQIQGAHAGVGLKEYNDHWVGICLVGDFNEGRPSARQMASLRRLVRYLQARCGIPDANVRTHRDVRDTECPGRRFPTREVLGGRPNGTTPAGK
jgi:N-acetylmuramoyl-L-alanine amidase